MRHGIAVPAVCAAFVWTANGRAADCQYQFEGIRIPRAAAEEAVRPDVSIAAATDYLEQGSLAWNGQHTCISCHTNGTYMTIRPALSGSLGPPAEANRRFFLEQLAELKKEPRDRLKQSTRPSQVIYLAAGLAEWDAHVTRSLSPETEQALEMMFEIQNDNGAGEEGVFSPLPKRTMMNTSVRLGCLGPALVTLVADYMNLRDSGNRSPKGGRNQNTCLLLSLGRNQNA